MSVNIQRIDSKRIWFNNNYLLKGFVAAIVYLLAIKTQLLLNFYEMFLSQFEY